MDCLLGLLWVLTAAPAGDAGRLYSAGAVGRREPRNVFPPMARPHNSAVHSAVQCSAVQSSAQNGDYPR